MALAGRGIRVVNEPVINDFVTTGSARWTHQPDRVEA
jgi:hypothetical protein